jgi:hypothetical protein
MADTAQVKEVVMDVGSRGDVGGDSQVGGGGSTRRRRRTAGGGRRRQTHKGDADADTGAAAAVAVDKIDGPAVAVPAPAVSSAAKKPAPAPVSAAPAPAPKVVIAPPKKKPAKVMLVPKKTHTVAHRPQKTFKAKRVRVTIDNTAKTLKKRRMTLARVDAMTEEQLRETAVVTKLSRIETVKKVPVDLLRQMLKDYYTMRGMFL